MSVVLLDTTVASALHPRRSASPVRAFYAPHMVDRTLALSFQSYAELWFWAEERHWGQAQRQALATFLDQFIIFPFTFGLGRAWARVMMETRAAGRRLEAGDAWIAASAVHYNVPLLTHDKDFTNLGVRGLNVICYAQ